MLQQKNHNLSYFKFYLILHLVATNVAYRPIRAGETCEQSLGIYSVVTSRCLLPLISPEQSVLPTVFVCQAGCFASLSTSCGATGWKVPWKHLLSWIKGSYLWSAPPPPPPHPPWALRAVPTQHLAVWTRPSGHTKDHRNADTNTPVVFYWKYLRPLGNTSQTRSAAGRGWITPPPDRREATKAILWAATGLTSGRRHHNLTLELNVSQHDHILKTSE